MTKTFGGDFEFHFHDKSGTVLAESVLPVDSNAYIAAETTTAEIRPPATNSVEDFLSNTREMLFKLSKTDKDLKLKCQPINEVNIELIQELLTKPTNLDCQAYESRVGRTLIDEKYRTQGGHIWLKRSNGLNSIDLVKLLDLFIALPLVLVFPSPDEAMRRRKYGKAGSYRERNGLLEYRVLSSSILQHPEILKAVLLVSSNLNDNYCNFVWLIQQAISAKVYTDKQLSSIINNNDVFKASKLWKNVFDYFIVNGVGNHFLVGWDGLIKYFATQPKPEDFLKNWFL